MQATPTDPADSRRTTPGGALALAALLLASAASAQASPTTLDFNALPTVTYGAWGVPPVTEDGFRLTRGVLGQSLYAFQDGWQAGRGGRNGTTTLGTYSATAGEDRVFTLNATDGGPFDLLSIDLGETFRPGDFGFQYNALSYRFVGLLAGGGTVSTSFNVDLLADGQGGIADFQTFNFNAGWSRLSSVQMHAITSSGTNVVYSSFDNIVVQASAPVAVPEPPALALVGAALAAAAALRRKPCGPIRA
jgi:hypothetical protein